MLKRIAAALAIISLTILSLIIPLIGAQPSTGTMIQVSPATLTVGQGTTFTLNVTITNVTNLATWNFGLFYLNTILTCTSVVEGPFLKQFNSTIFDYTIQNAYNATSGFLLAGSALYGAAPGVNGSGTLATITFEGTAAGSTILHFSDDASITYLYDATSPPPGQPIPFTAVDGAVNVTTTHDVAVTNVTSYKTVVGQGYADNLTVTTENLGNYTETFNVTVYANTTAVATQTVSSIAPLTSTALNFSWNTTSFAYGNYTISANATIAPGETNTGNNSFIEGWVVVSIVGDINGDGKVDMKDIALVARAFGSVGPNYLYPGSPPSSNWNPNADVNGDGVVNMRDVALVARNFGQQI